MNTLKEAAIQSPGWGPSELISLVIALIALVAAFLNSRQIKQAKVDNELSRKLTVSSINREGRVNIYADTISALRAIVADIRALVNEVEIEEVVVGPFFPNGPTLTMPRYKTDSDPMKGSAYQDRTGHIKQLQSFEHKSKMDLLGNADIENAVQELLTRINAKCWLFLTDWAVLIEKTNYQGETIESLTEALDRVQYRYKIIFEGLEEDIKEIIETMKHDLSLEA